MQTLSLKYDIHFEVIPLPVVQFFCYYHLLQLQFITSTSLFILPEFKAKQTPQFHISNDMFIIIDFIMKQ